MIHAASCSNMLEFLLRSPNGPGLVSWPQYDREKQEYMELGLAQAVKQKLKENRVHFAAVTLPQKLQQQAAAAKEEQWPPRGVSII